MIAVDKVKLFAKKTKSFLKKQLLSVIIHFFVKSRYDVNYICCVGKWFLIND